MNHQERDYKTCWSCNGTGSAWRGSEDVTCSVCGGSGRKQPESVLSGPGYRVYVRPAKEAADV